MWYQIALWDGFVVLGEELWPDQQWNFQMAKKPPSAIEIKFIKKLLCWYLTSSRVPSNFAIVARQNFAGFYFRNFSGQLCKNGIEFRDSSILNFILRFKKSEVF